MNINLDNYESFFLLYVDNELPAMQRKEVEDFLQHYPYLQSEMDALQEAVLPVQKSKFEFKADLLKPVIPDELLQENMLLHLDNELTGDEKKELEKLLLKDAHLQGEWSVLKKTKLDANVKVLFTDKHLLYRRERAKVITGRFVRLAVAALFIGAGFFAGIRFLNSEGTSNTPTATVPGKNNGETAPAVAVDKPVQVAPPNVQGNEAPKLATVDDKVKSGNAQRTQTDINQVPVSPVAVSVVKQAKTNPGAVEKEPAPMKVQTHSNIARLNQEANNDISRPEMIAANVKQQPTTLRDINMQPVENLFAKNASINVDEEDDDDHIFMIDEDKVARTKAAGFIKKIKRTVERTTKIKPGNSLRIAGFEFAVK